MGNDFKRATDTIILSDIHLADAEPPHPSSPLWKRFKRPEYFIDDSFQRLLSHIQETIASPVELVLNGDIFDFDSVMRLPAAGSSSEGSHISWLEKIRGLSSEEWKSRFKIEVILKDHAAWVAALRGFLARGNRLAFVFGNHDIELHWPSVREAIVSALGTGSADQIRFCEWFFISNGDTLIEHGNQFDAYSLCSNPINPLIKKGSKLYVRIPFGNLAGKFMLNGMGLMNPHAESSFIKDSIKEYIVFYFRYIMRTQPFILFTWLWSSIVTLVYSVGEGLLPAVRDPLGLDSRIQDIAERANATPQIVWSFRELHVHPAIFNPFKILRELWLDRALIFGLIIFASFQFFSTLNVFTRASAWWFWVPLLLLMPAFFFYARSVGSEVMSSQSPAFQCAPMSAQIARVKRVVQGHTHRELHTSIGDVEYLNTGTWSPAFHDVECMQPVGRKCFAWIKPSETKEGRSAELFEWTGTEARIISRHDHPSSSTNAET